MGICASVPVGPRPEFREEPAAAPAPAPADAGGAVAPTMPQEAPPAVVADEGSEEADTEIEEGDIEELDEEDALDMRGGAELAATARPEPMTKAEARAAMLRAQAAGSATATVEGAQPEDGAPRGELLVAALTIEEDEQAVPRFAFRGQFREPSDPPTQQPAKPAVEAALEWVHGYRGWDCRGNVGLVLDGSVTVYPAAAVVVLHDGTEQRHFTLHDDDVLSLAVHPSGKYVASGQIGRKAKVLVWDVETLEVMTVLEGVASRAARSVAFSGDGEVIAVAGEDDNHTVALYRWRESAKAIATAQAGREPVNGIALDATGGRLLTVGKRVAVMHAVGSSSSAAAASRGRGKSKGPPLMAATKVLMAGKGQSQTFWSAAFGVDGRAFIATHSGRVYEIAPGGRCVVAAFKIHGGPIASISAGPGADGGNVFTTTSKDGTVRVFSCRPGARGLGTAVATITNSEESGKLQCTRGAAVAPDLSRVSYGTRGGSVRTVALDGGVAGEQATLTTSHHSDELWGLAISPDGQTVATAGDDHTVRLWSVSERKQTASVEIGMMARAAAFSHDGATLVVGCGGRVGRTTTGRQGRDDGTVIAFSVPDLAEVARVKPSKHWISDVAFSPDDATVAVAAHDSVLYFLDASAGFSTKGKGGGSSASMLRVDFSADGRVARATTGAHELLFYDVATGDHMPGGAESMKDEDWDTVRCPLNWHVQGVWPSYADGTDINAVAVDSTQSIIASGDDFGRVKLYRFPCIENDMWECMELRGHSSHVTGVAFTPPGDDGSFRLFSAGGNDKTLMQWALTPTEDEVGGAVDIGTLA
ncbi:hypothetical protein FNF29_00568 [Cafeteria roenbergensis]|uniref:Uncharacterized protein n=1 Tax=Cafeteria roenbergensis TaxID=33653 RepID=A0A5A8CVY9_CAFRO|nr:hypothetical protein FNF29_00568 [Cafeteria roenbergensis]|eukprot:KAA0157216.1 hypothetical protein FNF29_00568 [Cafeteria roenbergensis]